MKRNHVIQIGCIFAIVAAWTIMAGIEHAQPPWEVPVTWNRTFGGSGDDGGACVRQTADGGYIVAGSESSGFGEGYTNLWLVKTDASGTEQWNKAFGNFTASANEVQQTTDSGYIAIGTFQIAKPEAYLIKTDSAGNEQWSRTWGGFPIGDAGLSVQQTAEGGYITAGTTFGTPGVGWLSKRDASGNEQWSRYFSDVSFFTEANSVRQTSDGGYIVCGAGYPSIDQLLDLWLIKTGPSGNIQWQRNYGGTGFERGYQVQQTLDGGYIAVGITNSYGAGSTDIWLIKTDGSGITQWGKTFGGSYYEEARSVEQTTDGGYILAGETGSFGAGNLDAWLIKTDDHGDRVWDKTLGGNASDEAGSVQQTSDGGYILAGTTQSYGAGLNDILLIKTDGNGNAPPMPSK